MRKAPCTCLTPLPRCSTCALQVYAHGEEAQARRLRAKLRWVRLRESLATLVPAWRQRRPLLPPRIAGPGRIRAAFIQPTAVQEAVRRLEQMLEERSVGAVPQQGPAGRQGPALPHGQPAPADAGPEQRLPPQHRAELEP